MGGVICCDALCSGVLDEALPHRSCQDPPPCPFANRRGGSICFGGTSDIRIVDISPLPEHRGQGVGTALLERVFAEAGAKGWSVSIHVEHFNPARALYDRLGFRELSRDGVYALMEWRCSAAGTGNIFSLYAEEDTMEACKA